MLEILSLVLLENENVHVCSADEFLKLVLSISALYNYCLQIFINCFVHKIVAVRKHTHELQMKKPFRLCVEAHERT